MNVSIKNIENGFSLILFKSKFPPKLALNGGTFIFKSILVFINKISETKNIKTIPIIKIIKLIKSIYLILK